MAAHAVLIDELLAPVKCERSICIVYVVVLHMLYCYICCIRTEQHGR